MRYVQARKVWRSDYYDSKHGTEVSWNDQFRAKMPDDFYVKYESGRESYLDSARRLNMESIDVENPFQMFANTIGKLNPTPESIREVRGILLNRIDNLRDY